MHYPFLARTPADFWRRYNRPVHQFLYEDVLKQLRGRQAPIRATLLIFVVSAMIHEYVMSIAIGTVQGYQSAFFLLQGVAVAATIRFKPRGWSAALSIVATLAFNLVSSVLFFASVSQIVPFYARSLPAWLEGWSLLGNR
jgi:hypothetical protein